MMMVSNEHGPCLRRQAVDGEPDLFLDSPTSKRLRLTITSIMLSKMMTLFLKDNYVDDLDDSDDPDGSV